MKRQVGWRLNRLLLNQFTELCREEGLRPSEAVEEFMRKALTIGNITESLSLITSNEPKAILSRELRAKMIIADLTGELEAGAFLEYYYDYHEPKLKELLKLIPGIRDPKLIEDIQELCEKVNHALKGIKEENES